MFRSRLSWRTEATGSVCQEMGKHGETILTAVERGAPAKRAEFGIRLERIEQREALPCGGAALRQLQRPQRRVDAQGLGGRLGNDLAAVNARYPQVGDADARNEREDTCVGWRRKKRGGM